LDDIVEDITMDPVQEAGRGKTSIRLQGHKIDSPPPSHSSSFKERGSGVEDEEDLGVDL